MAEVGCAGILVSDTFCGPMASLPQEGMLLTVDNLPTMAGGCAANVAIDLRRQGVTVDISGCLGSDPSAQVLLASLGEHQVGCERIVYSPDLPTSKTVILLVEGQDRRYIHSFGANAAFAVDHIDRAWVQGLKVLYIGGLFLMPSFRLDDLLGLLEFCRAQRVTSVVDVVIPENAHQVGDISALLRLSDYFLPNEDEAQILTGSADPLEQLRALMRMGGNTVFVTRGSKGSLAARGHSLWQAGTYPTQVVDPSGGGDAFASGVVMGALRGWSLPETIRYASALGASAISALGTTAGVFTAGQAREFVARQTLDLQESNFEW